jgi:hypothetical protein
VKSYFELQGIITSKSQPVEITRAIQLFKQNQLAESRQILREYLSSQPGNVEALLWLAKVTSDSREAVAAAELALALEPENEIAKRGVLAVHARFDAPQQDEPPIDIARTTGMTLTQARAVKWPFQNINRPVGVILDDGTKRLRDLAWAFEDEQVWDTNLKQAARTILLSRLLGDKLKEPPPPLEVIEGSAYTAYKERAWLSVNGILLGLGVGGVITMIIGWVVVVYLALAQPALYRAVGPFTWLLFLVLIIVVYVAGRVSDYAEKMSRQYRAGREGESKVIDALRASLTQPWVLIRNMEWADRKWGDVDLILLGSGGVWAFEVKAYTGDYRVNGDRWQYKSRWGWRTMRKDPGAQARRNARNVKDYLDLNGVNVKWVQPVVIWAGEDERLIVDAPSTPVWRLAELSDRAEEFWLGRKLSDEQIQQAVAILTKELDKVKTKEAGHKKDVKKGRRN